MPEARLITALDELTPYATAWDRLAEELHRPFCAPAWMLGWFRHLTAPGAGLRTVVVLERGELIGIAPYFFERSARGRVDYRLLGSGTAHRVSPLARRGDLSEVARLTSEALAHSSPRPDIVTFEGIDEASEWPAEFRRAWPGRFRPWQYRATRHAVPVLEIGCRNYAEWFNEKSASFRREMRQKSRQLAARGVTLRLSTTDRVDEDITAFIDLHYGRWARRGGSAVVDEAVERLLRRVAADLIGRERFRLWILEAAGQPISAQISLAAGGEVALWNSGFDQAWSRYSPAVQTILAAIEDAFSRGESRVDLGAGADAYKLRFANGDDPILWTGLVPRTGRYPLIRWLLLPSQADWLARRTARRLPPVVLARLKQLVRRSK
jgi:CelD/BcsL family acetyltransferase involved in cellulose biosynthesis